MTFTRERLERGREHDEVMTAFKARQNFQVSHERQRRIEERRRGMRIVILENEDGSEQAVQFLPDYGGDPLPSTVFDGELFGVLDEQQVNFDGDNPELEKLLLDQVFFRYVDIEDAEEEEDDE